MWLATFKQIGLQKNGNCISLFHDAKSIVRNDKQIHLAQTKPFNIFNDHCFLFKKSLEWKQSSQ